MKRMRVRVTQLQRMQPGRSAEKLHGKNGIRTEERISALRVETSMFQVSSITL